MLNNELLKTTKLQNYNMITTPYANIKYVMYKKGEKPIRELT